MLNPAENYDVATDIRDVMDVAGQLAGDRAGIRAWIEFGRSRAALPHVAVCARCTGPEVKAIHEPAQERVIDFRSRQRDAKK